MPDEQLQASFTAAPQHPIWKAILQLATEAYRGYDYVIKTPGIAGDSLQQAIGGQLALETLMAECRERILATRSDDTED